MEHSKRQTDRDSPQQAQAPAGQRREGFSIFRDGPARAQMMERWRRKFLHADLEMNEPIPEPRRLGLSYSRPKDFLSMGGFGRWAEIIWWMFVLLFLLFSSSVTVMGLVMTALTTERGPAVWGSALFFLLLLPFLLWLTANAQAYLRWMFRNRNQPRLTR